MQALSDDDLNPAELSDEELLLAWELWFDLAQTTNDDDPPYTQGEFQLARLPADPWLGNPPAVPARPLEPR